jgi:hypothetical protein
MLPVLRVGQNPYIFLEHKTSCFFLGDMLVDANKSVKRGMSANGEYRHCEEAATSSPLATKQSMRGIPRWIASLGNVPLARNDTCGGRSGLALTAVSSLRGGGNIVVVSDEAIQTRDSPPDCFARQCAARSQ